ncbi:MAG: hypothetical protein AB7P01_15055 [Bacteroidia bacterium]
MAHRILIFVSEVLAMHSIKPLITRLKQDTAIEVNIIHDGFCTEEINKHNIDYTLIEAPFAENVKPFLENCDLIISGKSYAQLSELELLALSKELQIPYYMLIPDIGGEIALAKLTDFRTGELLLPDKIFIADKCTHEYLINHSVPNELIVPTGSPHFDKLYKRIEQGISDPVKNLIVYISTPFELDYERGILNACYKQSRFIREIKAASDELSLKIIAKRHTQINADLFAGITMYEGDIVPLLMQACVVVGSYSTGLIEAAVMGIPVISYQPWTDNIRQDVFTERIPITKSYKQFVAKIKSALSFERSEAEEITYNPGKSLAVIIRHIYSEIKS